MRVLYSFPHKLGAGRICDIAWQQVAGLLAAGVEVIVFPGALHKAVPGNVECRPTLAVGKLRIPYRMLGTRRACALHDRIVSRRLRKLSTKIDLVHTWPLGALQTLKTARRLGIPTVLERPNTHTRFAYAAVRDECRRLGVTLPPGSEGAFDAAVLSREEAEYELADRLLCPSAFVLQTFVQSGYPLAKLARHTYGYDENVFHPSEEPHEEGGLRMLFVGYCAVRKGLHYALEAWLRSPVCENGTFTIAGDFLPAYAERLAPLLRHPTVRVLGHRNDVPELMRNSDILVLPSVEEGFGLVIAEAMASGCVPLASRACTEICKHMVTGLVHDVGDTRALEEHITLLDGNRDLLKRLRATGLAARPAHTWRAAGLKLMNAYRDLLADDHRSDGCARK